MFIIVKIFLVALAVFGQAKLFPEHSPANNASVSPSMEKGLDGVVLPEEKPELVLAQRAMQAQGLCPSAKNAAPEKTGSVKNFPSGLDSASAPASGEPSKSDLATNCF
ncbi:MAG: hypothetical protein ABI036_08820 [Fibrobacteria bacterium]